MKIPLKILDKINQNSALHIEWAGHRDSYEIIEEWTDSLFWLGNLWIGAYYLTYLLPFSFHFKLAVFFISLICLIPALYESIKWSSEWHVLCRDVEKGGGMYFKAEGITSVKISPLEISKTLPTTDEYANNLIYWFWKKMTNHRLERVTLKSDAGIFLLSNNRMNPEFSNTWFRLRGPLQMIKKEQDETWFDVENLIRTITRQYYDPKEGERLIRDLINRKFYG